MLRGRYPLVWQKVLCYKYGRIGHRKSDHKEKTKKIEKKQEVEKDKIDKKEMKKRDRKKKGKSDKKKIKKINVVIETEREIVIEKREKRNSER